MFSRTMKKVTQMDQLMFIAIEKMESIWSGMIEKRG